MQRFKHVFLISIDTLRFDCSPLSSTRTFLSEQGVESYLKTPTLDSLVRHSWIFPNTFTTASYTPTAHASVFTGLYPPKHNVRSLLNPTNHSLSNSAITMAETFSDEGFETIFASDEPLMLRPLGLSRGFTKEMPINDDLLLKYIKKNNRKSLFVFKHFFDIHDPYLWCPYEQNKNTNLDYKQMIFGKLGGKYRDGDPYTEWRKKYGGVKNNVNTLLPLYVKGVTKFDQGRFASFIEGLHRAKVMDDSLLVIFSDHGEGRCDSNNLNFFAHGGELFNEVVHVPLMLYNPRFKQKTFSSLKSLVDVYPTLVKLLFRKTPSYYPRYKLDGESLLNKVGHKFVYAEFWRSNKEHPQDYPTNDQWLLAERMVRTSKNVVRLRGRPECMLQNRSLTYWNEWSPRYLNTSFDTISVEEPLILEKLIAYMESILNNQSTPPLRFGTIQEEAISLLPNPFLSKMSLLNKLRLKRLLHWLFTVDRPELSIASNNAFKSIRYLKYIQNIVEH